MNHKHHIIPKHRIKKWIRDGIIDEATSKWLNRLVVEVTLEEHIKIHKCWYDEFGNRFDLLAYKRLEHAIGKEEHILGILSEAGKIGGSKPKLYPKWTEERKRNYRNPFLGKRHTEETKQKISEIRKLRGLGKGESNPFFGKTHSEATKEKMRKSWETRDPITEQTREKQSLARRGSKNHNYGKKMPLAVKEQIYITITCPHCGKSGCRPAMKRWHFDNCKDNLEGKDCK